MQIRLDISVKQDGKGAEDTVKRLEQVKESAESLGRSLKQMVVDLREVPKQASSLRAIAGAGAESAKTLGAMATSAGKLNSALGGILQKSELTGTALGLISLEAKDATRHLNDLWTVLYAVSPLLRSIANGGDKAALALEAMGKKAEAHLHAMTAYAAAVERAAMGVGKLAGNREILKDARQAMKQVDKDVKESADHAVRQQQRVTEETKRETIKRIAEGVKAQRALQKGMAETFKNTPGAKPSQQKATADFAGVGLLNYVNKLPFGNVLGPLLGITKLLPGIGKATILIGGLVAGFTILKTAISATIGAAETLLRKFFDLTVQGFEYNGMLKTSQAGLAAIVSTFTEVTDLNGRVLTGNEKFTASMRISAGVQNQLRAAAIQTAASYEELVRAMQEAAGPAFSKGFSPAQLTTFTIDVAKTAQAIGLPFDQLNQEVRGLLEGDMSRNSRIARLLLSDIADTATKSGSTVEKEIKKMAKAGTLFGYLHERMAEFNKAAEETANTFPVAMSNLRDAFQSALGQATAGSVGTVTSKIKELTDSIVTFDQFGNAKFGAGMQQALTTMATLIGTLLEKLIKLALKLDEIVFKFSYIMKLDPSQIAEIATKKLTSNVTYGGLAMDMANPFKAGPFNPATQGKLVTKLVSDALGWKNRNMNGTNGQGGAGGWSDQQAFGTDVNGAYAAHLADQQKGLEAQRLRYVARGEQIIRGGVGVGKGSMREITRLDYGKSGGVQLEGFSPELYRQKIGEFEDKFGAAKTADLLKLLSVDASNGKITFDEFSASLVNAEVGAVATSKAFADTGDKVKDMTSKVDASVNSLESLAEQMRSLAEQSDNMLAGLDTDLIGLKQGISTGLLERQAADLQREVSTIEANVDSEGNLSSDQMRQVSELKLLIIERQREIALAKERYALQEKQLKLDESSEKLAAITAKREKIENDLEQARVKVKALSGKGTDKQKADAAAAVANFEAQRNEVIQDEILIGERIKDLRVQTTVQSNLAISAVNADFDAQRQQEAADAAKKIAKNDAKNAKETETRWSKTLKAIRKQWEEMGKAIGGAVNQGLKSMISGEGDFGDAARSFASSVVDGVVNTLTDHLSAAMTDLFAYASMTQAEQEAKYGKGKGPMGLNSKQAKGVSGGIAGIAGAYQLSQIGGATRGQNIMAGVSTGAATGAQVGSLFTAVGGQMWGAVIGAVVGAIVGYMAPTADKIGMRFTNRNGILWVQGLGDAKAYQVQDAMNQLNRSIANTRSGMMDIFLNLPSSVLAAIATPITGLHMPEFNEIIDPVTSAGDKIKNFLTVEIPKLVLNQYIPALGEVASLLGVSQKRVDEFKKYVGSLDVADAQAFVAKYFEQLSTFGEIAKFGAMNIDQRTQFAKSVASKTPIDRMAEINAKIGSVLPTDYRNLSLEEQTQIGDKLMPLIKERYQLEIDYLNEIRTTMEANLKSIDDQIFGFQMEDMSPQQQMDAILARARDAKDQIRLATTPAEVARLSQEYQNLINQAVQIGGNRPEDRANAIAGLTDLREIVAARYEELRAAVEAQAKPYFDLINQILTGLRDGIALVVKPPKTGEPPATEKPPGGGRGRAVRGGGGGADGGGPIFLDPSDPSTWGDLFGHIKTNSVGTGASIGDLGDAAATAAAAWKRFADGTAGAPVTDGDRNAAAASAPIINLVVEGDIAPLVTRIRSEVVSEAVERSTRTAGVIRRRSSRF